MKNTRLSVKFSAFFLALLMILGALPAIGDVGGEPGFSAAAAGAASVAGIPEIEMDSVADSQGGSVTVTGTRAVQIRWAGAVLPEDKSSDPSALVSPDRTYFRILNTNGSAVDRRSAVIDRFEGLLFAKQPGTYQVQAYTASSISFGGGSSMVPTFNGVTVRKSINVTFADLADLPRLTNIVDTAGGGNNPAGSPYGRAFQSGSGGTSNPIGTNHQNGAAAFHSHYDGADSTTNFATNYEHNADSSYVGWSFPQRTKVNVLAFVPRHASSATLSGAQNSPNANRTYMGALQGSNEASPPSGSSGWTTLFVNSSPPVALDGTNTRRSAVVAEWYVKAVDSGEGYLHYRWVGWYASGGTPLMNGATSDGRSRANMNEIALFYQEAEQNITLDKSSLALNLSEGPASGVVTARVSDGWGGLAFSSSDPGVATVAASGLTCTVTAVGVGTATITATATDGENFESARATVTVARTNPISVSPASLALDLTTNPSGALSASLLPAWSGAAVTFRSSDEGVATVTDSGAVTAKGVGSAVITASVTKDGVTDTAAAAVSVVRTNPVSLPASLGLNLVRRPSATISASLVPAWAGQEVSFSISDTGVASIAASGLSVTVTAVGLGTATITASVTKDGVTDKAETVVRVSDNANEWGVVSPDGNSEINVFLNEETGALTYNAVQSGEQVIQTSSLGFNTSLGDFRTGLLYLVEENRAIDETYGVLSGKASTYVNKANEKTLIFSKGDMEISLALRAYNDGVAYRYTIARADGAGAEITLSAEGSTFAVPASSTVIFQNNPSASSDAYHENAFSSGTISTSGVNGEKVMPLLYETPSHKYVLINEAAMTGQYCGSTLTAASNSNILRVTQVGQQQGQGFGLPKTTTPFTSPWRYAVIGGPAAVMENTMAENLSPPPDYDKYKFDEWVKPGCVSWLWLVGGRSLQSNLNELKTYVDLSAEMGWEHIILDEGWQPAARGAYNNDLPTNYNFKDLVDYGREKGVGIFVWVHVSDIDTPAKIQKCFSFWRGLGITGVKADFFNKETQNIMQLYDDVYRIAAENKLMLLSHGTNKPTGEIRTYPHLLGREGIYGEEKSAGQNGPNLLRTLFTRCAVGPTDFTPQIYPRPNSTITTSAQLAINIVYESGMPVMADNANNYRNSPAYPILKYFPARWDETVFVAGDPYNYAALARRNGDSWYVGALNNATQKTVSLRLDFLKEGVSYRAEVYRDVVGGGKNDMTVDVIEVKKGDAISVTLLGGTNAGGCGIRIVPKGFYATAGHIMVSGDKASVNTQLQNFQDFDQSCNVIMAAYDSAGKLAGLEMKPVTVLRGATTRPDVLTSLSGLAPGAGYTVKVMVWDENYVPLSDAYSYKLG